MRTGDELIEPEDIVCDAIYDAVEMIISVTDFKIDAEKFFESISCRTERLRVSLAFKILAAKNRYEFEELMHNLYIMGIED